MSAAKKNPKASKDTGRGAGSAEIDTSAAANDESEGGSRASKVAKGGDSTGKSHPLVNTGADSLPNATRAAPIAVPEGFKKGESKKIWLDKVYTFHGRHYGPSAHPGDHIEVPKDFPEDIVPPEPSLKDWRPPAESSVIEVPDDSKKPL